MVPGANPEYGTRAYRLHYTSLATPDSVYDADLDTGELTLLKRKPVLPLPGRAGTRGTTAAPRVGDRRRRHPRPDLPDLPEGNTTRRKRAMRPLRLRELRDIRGSLLLDRLSLLDRGFVYAVAHVRGGGEMGRRWYDDGKMLRKTNTFTDFVACAEHLASRGWTGPRRLIAA